MALLDMSRKMFKHIEVGHVNYHKRDSASRDEKIVRRYCKKYNIKFHILNYNPNNTKGNFQSDARIARYNFFSKICNKNGLDGVLVAHHKDDLIETYLMQIDKKLGVNCYGLSHTSYLYGAIVTRPLLDFTKKELIEYCELNKIEYGVDESNLSNDYERNRVRHNIVEKMSDDEKDKLIKEINKKNRIIDKQLFKSLNVLNSKSDFSVKEFLRIPYLKTGLRNLFKGKSDKFYDEMIRQIKESKSYQYIEDYCISKEYDRVHIFIKPKTYTYKFNSLDELKTKKYDYFKIAKKGSNVEGVTLSAKDFPITIRSYKEGDSISMLYGTKKINRFFIDNKILIKDRMIWPIVLNKKGNAILVPGIGCDKSHYSLNHNLYVLKLLVSEDI